MGLFDKKPKTTGIEKVDIFQAESEVQLALLIANPKKKFYCDSNYHRFYVDGKPKKTTNRHIYDLIITNIQNNKLPNFHQDISDRKHPVLWYDVEDKTSTSIVKTRFEEFGKFVGEPGDVDNISIYAKVMIENMLKNPNKLIGVPAHLGLIEKQKVWEIVVDTLFKSELYQTKMINLDSAKFTIQLYKPEEKFKVEERIKSMEVNNSESLKQHLFNGKVRIVPTHIFIGNQVIDKLKHYQNEYVEIPEIDGDWIQSEYMRKQIFDYVVEQLANIKEILAGHFEYDNENLKIKFVVKSNDNYKPYDTGLIDEISFRVILETLQFPDKIIKISDWVLDKRDIELVFSKVVEYFQKYFAQPFADFNYEFKSLKLRSNVLEKTTLHEYLFKNLVSYEEVKQTVEMIFMIKDRPVKTSTVVNSHEKSFRAKFKFDMVCLYLKMFYPNKYFGFVPEKYEITYTTFLTNEKTFNYIGNAIVKRLEETPGKVQYISQYLEDKNQIEKLFHIVMSLLVDKYEREKFETQIETHSFVFYGDNTKLMSENSERNIDVEKDEIKFQNYIKYFCETVVNNINQEFEITSRLYGKRQNYSFKKAKHYCQTNYKNMLFTYYTNDVDKFSITCHGPIDNVEPDKQSKKEFKTNKVSFANIHEHVVEALLASPGEEIQISDYCDNILDENIFNRVIKHLMENFNILDFVANSETKTIIYNPRKIVKSSNNLDDQTSIELTPNKLIKEAKLLDVEAGMFIEKCRKNPNKYHVCDAEVSKLQTSDIYRYLLEKIHIRHDMKKFHYKAIEFKIGYFETAQDKWLADFIEENCDDEILEQKEGVDFEEIIDAFIHHAEENLDSCMCLTPEIVPDVDFMRKLLKEIHSKVRLKYDEGDFKLRLKDWKQFNLTIFSKSKQVSTCTDFNEKEPETFEELFDQNPLNQIENKFKEFREFVDECEKSLSEMSEIDLKFPTEIKDALNKLKTWVYPNKDNLNDLEKFAKENSTENSTGHQDHNLLPLCLFVIDNNENNNNYELYDALSRWFPNVFEKETLDENFVKGLTEENTVKEKKSIYKKKKSTSEIKEEKSCEKDFVEVPKKKI